MAAAATSQCGGRSARRGAASHARPLRDRDESEERKKKENECGGGVFFVFFCVETLPVVGSVVQSLKCVRRVPLFWSVFSLFFFGSILTE